MVSIKDINKNIKKNLFDPIDKTKNKISSLLNDFKKNKVKKDLALQKQLEKALNNPGPYFLFDMFLFCMFGYVLCSGK